MAGWGADKPFLNRLAILRWKARYPFWPPQDASPVTPIEPWGKQFFVYNAPHGVEFKGDPRAPTLDHVRPAWIRDMDAVSMLQGSDDNRLLGTTIGGHKLAPTLAGRRAAAAKVGAGGAPMLCATDYRQRPLMFLSPDEWAAFRQQIPKLREELQRCQEKIDSLDQRGVHMRDYYLRLKWVEDKHKDKRRGVMMYGGNSGRSYESATMGIRARERLKRTTQQELSEIERRGQEDSD